MPINVGGWLELPDGTRVGITRAHMEEDTGKTTHVGGGGRIHEAGYALVDYNRAGVPLVEIVSDPDIRSADQAKAYVEELRGILAAIEVSDVKMEEGSLRVDSNVSMRPAGRKRASRSITRSTTTRRSRNSIGTSPRRTTSRRPTTSITRRTRIRRSTSRATAIPRTGSKDRRRSAC